MLEIRTKNGSTIKTTGAGLKVIDLGLDELTAPLKKLLESNLKDIEDHARDEWPWNFNRSKQNQIKPHSRDMFTIKTKKVIDGGNLILESSLHNKSEYAYMIKTSKKFTSKTKIGQDVKLADGAHVFSRLMWAPMQKTALKVANETANLYLKMLRRVA